MMSRNSLFDEDCQLKRSIIACSAGKKGMKLIGLKLRRQRWLYIHAQQLGKHVLHREWGQISNLQAKNGNEIQLHWIRQSLWSIARSIQKIVCHLICIFPIIAPLLRPNAARSNWKFDIDVWSDDICILRCIRRALYVGVKPKNYFNLDLKRAGFFLRALYKHHAANGLFYKTISSTAISPSWLARVTPSGLIQALHSCIPSPNLSIQTRDSMIEATGCFLLSILMFPSTIATSPINLARVQ